MSLNGGEDVIEDPVGFMPLWGRECVRPGAILGSLEVAVGGQLDATRFSVEALEIKLKVIEEAPEVAARLAPIAPAIAAKVEAATVKMPKTSPHGAHFFFSSSIAAEAALRET